MDVIDVLEVNTCHLNLATCAVKLHIDTRTLLGRNKVPFVHTSPHLVEPNPI